MDGSEDNGTKNKTKPRRPRGGVRKRGRSFEARWTDHEGRLRQRCFATRSDAELEIKRQTTRAEEVRRGVLRLAPDAHTFGELEVAWLEAKARKRSLDHDRSILGAHLVPFFGRDRRLSTITFGEIERFKTSGPRAKLHPNTVNHHLTLLGGMLRHAVRLGWIDRVPEIRKNRVEVLSECFRYLQSDEEVRRFLDAARDEGPDVFDLYASAILTGARAGELAGLAWEDVDFARGMVYFRRSFDGPTKSGKARPVVLVDALRPILEARRMRVGAAGRVFTSKAGTPFLPSSNVFQEVLRRVLARGRFPPRYITFHSLRHTFASHMMMDGGDLYRLQRLLGHQSASMTQRYAHLSPAAFDVDRARLSRLVPSAPAEVIPLARSRR
jgi:integrase